jgi:hypothetical protein
MQKFTLYLAIALTISNLMHLPLQAVQRSAPVHIPPTYNLAQYSPFSLPIQPLGESQRQILEQVAQLTVQITDPFEKAYTLVRLAASHHRYGQINQASELLNQSLGIVRTLTDEKEKAALFAEILAAQVTMGQEAAAGQILPEFILTVQSLPESQDKQVPIESVSSAYLKSGDFDTALKLIQLMTDKDAQAYLSLSLSEDDFLRSFAEQKHYEEAIALIQSISVAYDSRAGGGATTAAPDQILQTKINALISFASIAQTVSSEGEIPPEVRKIYEAAQQLINQISDNTTRLKQQADFVRNLSYIELFGEDAVSRLKQLLEIIPAEQAVSVPDRAYLLMELIPKLSFKYPDDPLVKQSLQALQQLVASLPETGEARQEKTSLLLAISQRFADTYPEVAQTTLRSLQTLLSSWGTSNDEKKQKAYFLLDLANPMFNIQPDRNLLQEVSELSQTLPVGDRSGIMLQVARHQIDSGNKSAALVILNSLAPQARAIAEADDQQGTESLSLLIDLLIQSEQIDTAAKITRENQSYYGYMVLINAHIVQHKFEQALTIIELFPEPYERIEYWSRVAAEQARTNQRVQGLKTMKAVMAYVSAQPQSQESFKFILAQAISTYSSFAPIEELIQILESLNSLPLQASISEYLALEQATGFSAAPPGTTLSSQIAELPIVPYWRSLIPKLLTSQERDQAWASLAVVCVQANQLEKATEAIGQIQSISRKANILMTALELEALRSLQVQPSTNPAPH